MRLVDGFIREVPWFRQRYDYGARTDGQPVYIGGARIASADSDPVWIIHYLQYDSNGYVTTIESKEGAWSARVALFA